nr:MAG TPA: hypothetical protein [Caudoviricetes sp.]
MPGDSTINPYRHTQNHREDNSIVSERRQYTKYYGVYGRTQKALDDTRQGQNTL